MKTQLFIPVIAAAVLLAAAYVRADLGHSWDAGSELPAAVDTAPADSADSSDSVDSADNTDGCDPSSLDAQIVDLLDDESLASSSSSSLDLPAVTVSLTEGELLRDRLAVEVAADAEAPSTPDTSAPIGASDTAFATGTDRIATRVSSAMAVQGVSSADTTPTFTASDSSSFKQYDNGWDFNAIPGSGFGDWHQVAGAAPPNYSINRNDDQGFAIYANDGVGEANIGHSFADGIALETGSFSVQATHDSTAHFSGFALYSAGDTEILRWGLSTEENTEDGGGFATGFWYFRNGQATLIRTIDASAPVAADYSVSWSLLSSGMAIDLSITSGGTTDIQHLTLDNSSAVTAIAALVAGSDPKDTLHFDNLEVTGRAVPEPATLALLLLGALALHPFRRR